MFHDVSSRYYEIFIGFLMYPDVKWNLFYDNLSWCKVKTYAKFGEIKRNVYPV